MKFMKNKLTVTGAIGLSAVLALGVLGGCSAPGGDTPNNGDAGTILGAEFSGADADAAQRSPDTIDLSNAVTVSMSGDFAQADDEGDEGIAVLDGVITVRSPGTYVFSGNLTDGRILVDAKGEDVVLVLNGADITCSYGSPLYIYKSSSTTVHLMEGTENSLTDSGSYTFADEYSSQTDDEPNACLYSKSDLILQGAGSLTVNANYNNGITSKDTLEIYNLNLTVNAANHGINGRDSNKIDSAAITVSCGGDAIRSTNDSDTSLGWVGVSNSSLDLNSGEDGIQAETALSISNGRCTIVSGGGSGKKPSGDTSAKGIKAGSDLNLNGGIYLLDCSDDAVHSNGNLSICGGSYSISSCDDAMHADGRLTVSNGEIDILTSYEGLEGADVEISGGTVHLISSDDGLNAAGGADGSGLGGFGNGNAFNGPDFNHSITISGGCVVVQAAGDGLDSNGSINISGGTVVVSSSGRGDGALDYDGGFTLSGGILFASDTGAMSAAPDNAGQYTAAVRFDTTLSAGTYVAFIGEKQTFTVQLPVDSAFVLFSSPELEGGGTYTVVSGGTYSGEMENGIGTNGACSGGTVLTELTLSDYLTTYGNIGMGGMHGGFGGRPNGNFEGNADDWRDRKVDGRDGKTGGGPGNRPDAVIGATMDGLPEEKPA